jgi:hypothetical protein
MLMNRGRIHLQGIDRNAVIYLDGALQNQQQLEFMSSGGIVKNVLRGTRSVRVERAGFSPWEQNILVTGQQRIVVAVSP